MCLQINGANLCQHSSFQSTLLCCQGSWFRLCSLNVILRSQASSKKYQEIQEIIVFCTDVGRRPGNFEAENISQASCISHNTWPPFLGVDPGSEAAHPRWSTEALGRNASLEQLTGSTKAIFDAISLEVFQWTALWPCRFVWWRSLKHLALEPLLLSLSSCSKRLQLGDPLHTDETSTHHQHCSLPQANATVVLQSTHP